MASVELNCHISPQLISTHTIIVCDINNLYACTWPHPINNSIGIKYKANIQKIRDKCANGDYNIVVAYSTLVNFLYWLYIYSMNVNFADDPNQGFPQFIFVGLLLSHLVLQVY